MTYKIEVLILPVGDVDPALAFYAEKVGFSLDVDYRPTDDFGVVQLTPPGSNCSIQIGVIRTATNGCCRNAGSGTYPAAPGLAPHCPAHPGDEHRLERQAHDTAGDLGELPRVERHVDIGGEDRDQRRDQPPAAKRRGARDQAGPRRLATYQMAQARGRRRE